MASATLDVVLAMESKLRDNVKSDALRWNATSQQFERFDGSAWAACVDVPSDVVHKAGAETITGAKTFSGGLSGTLTGNVTGNCSGSSGSCTGNAATATTASSCSGNSATATTASACSGNSVTATALATARTIQTNLASSASASFDGSANVTPGVTGVLPVANGGTGATSLSSITVGEATKATQDGSGNVITSTYLPLSGGTMTGRIICDGVAKNPALSSSNDSDFLRLNGGQPEGYGAYLVLYGGTNSGVGEFDLTASSSAGNSVLRGTVAGGLTWNGCVVDRINTYNTNVIRYESGFQIYRALFSLGSVAATTVSWSHTFAYAFSSNPCAIVTWWGGCSGAQKGGVESLSSTQASGFWYNSASVSGVTLQMVAVGPWK